jgi:predicted nucleotide-binding protein (sugar kinase/HSP70/actin superfamily)
MWAAKFVARHPHLLAVEFSSFKCGHDAPMYSIIRDIFRSEGKPYFTFIDMDENTPQNSLHLRLETIRHSLAAYERTRRQFRRLTK